MFELQPHDVPGCGRRCQFRIPQMYAALVVFALAGLGNAAVGRIRPRGMGA